MSKIKTTKQFKEQVDAAFATMQTRDEAKACYEFQREEYKTAEAELCAYANDHTAEAELCAYANARPRTRRDPGIEAQGKGGVASGWCGPPYVGGTRSLHGGFHLPTWRV